METDRTAPTAAGGSLFHPRTLAIGIPVVALSLIASLLASVIGPEIFEPVDVAPSAYSRSAVGHRAFVQLLGEVGIEVEVSRRRSGEKARDQGVLLIAEPRPTREKDAWRHTFLRELEAEVAIVVLPKREASAELNRRFAKHVYEVDEEEILSVLEQLTEWTGSSGEWELETLSAGPEDWRGRLASIPDLAAPQLVSHPDLDPWLETDEGALIGELRGLGDRRIVLVSDPDLIANHSFWTENGANAKLAIELITNLLPEGETLIIDEGCRDHGKSQGFWREALRFPLVLVLLQCVLLFSLVVWSAFGRFGPAIPEAVGLEAGSRRLVHSAAELLRFGRHRDLVIRKYLRLAIDAACARLHGPTTGTISERAAWLAERERPETKSLGITELTEAAHALGARGSEEDFRELALAIDRWRWEIVNGSEGDRSGR